jgi:hypothetical protein
MQKSFYTLWFRLHQTNQYLIWIQAEEDLVYIEEGSYMPIFDSEATLKAYAHTKHILLEDDPPLLHNLDLAKYWLAKPHDKFEHLEFLATWHLFGDIARSAHKSFLGNQKDPLTNKVYDKLYAGNNYPKELYDAHWTVTELTRLAEVLNEGFQLMSGVAKEVRK